MYSLIAMMAALIGVAGLYSSWRRLALAGPGVVAGSWLLIVLSGWIWCLGWGVEFGTVFACLALSVAGGVFLLLNYEVRERKSPRPADTQQLVINPRTWGRHALLSIIVFPVAGTLSVVGSILLAHEMPWIPVNQMVLAVLLIPVIWGAAAYWACADPLPGRPAIALGVGALLSLACLYL
ncbi:MAG: hypothetical protein H6990_07400 [Pseudomonadales bacterium]|nr:hypothetical protein [Pseudomonadales bacterium]MCP5205338.1 hypothetical protein [Pseudomonadales bacterium]